LDIDCTFRLDDRGDVHLHSRSPGSHSDCILDDDFHDVQHNGHVEWHVRDGHVRVRLRPSLISPGAYARVMEWLTSHPLDRVLLLYFVEGRWEYEFLRKPSEAARRIRWLVKLYGGGGNCNFRRQEVLLSSCLQPTAWKAAIDFWSELREQVDPATAGEKFDEFFGGRWILYGLQGDQFFSVCAFGTNHSNPVRKWLKANHGRRVSEPLNGLFGQSCAGVYQSAMRAFEPRADETDAITHWTGYGRRRSCFRRLALPFRFRGQTWVLSGIELDPTIELLD